MGNRRTNIDTTVMKNKPIVEEKDIQKRKKFAEKRKIRRIVGKENKILPEEEWVAGIQTQFGEIFPEIESDPERDSKEENGRAKRLEKRQLARPVQVKI